MILQTREVAALVAALHLYALCRRHGVWPAEALDQRIRWLAEAPEGGALTEAEALALASRIGTNGKELA